VSPTLTRRFGQPRFANLPIARCPFDRLRVEANAWLLRFQDAARPVEAIAR
jgi:hypothetical protein